MAEERTVCRGIRGAITVEEDRGQQPMAQATRELLDAIVEANECRPEDLAAVIFTVTDDLAGHNPAAAAREHGFVDVPLLQVKEHAGEPHVARCLRVLLLWNTTSTQSQIKHVYLKGAATLRPDLGRESAESGTGGRP
ncbi:MAG TPA: chorismate mutase [Actinomycetota bacterium]|nr:chorismate mutase [Actinomycetota bacterium]